MVLNEKNCLQVLEYFLLNLFVTLDHSLLFLRVQKELKDGERLFYTVLGNYKSTAMVLAGESAVRW